MTDVIESIKDLLSHPTQPTTTLSRKQLFYFYNIVVRRTLLDTYRTHYDLLFTLACMTTVSHVFQCVYTYIGNPDTTYIVCQKAILLCNEYLTISKNIHRMIPSYHDIQQFVYAKTIGYIHPKRKQEVSPLMDVSYHTLCDCVQTVYVRLIEAYHRYHRGGVHIPSPCILTVPSVVYYPEHKGVDSDNSCFQDVEILTTEWCEYVVDTIVSTLTPRIREWVSFWVHEMEHQRDWGECVRCFRVWCLTILLYNNSLSRYTPEWIYQHIYNLCKHIPTIRIPDSVPDILRNLKDTFYREYGIRILS